MKTTRLYGGEDQVLCCEFNACGTIDDGTNFLAAICPTSIAILLPEASFDTGVLGRPRLPLLQLQPLLLVILLPHLAALHTYTVSRNLLLLRSLQKQRNRFLSSWMFLRS